jgi:hypothetical protein
MKFKGLAAVVYQLFPLDGKLLGLLPLQFLIPAPPAPESANPEPPDPDLLSPPLPLLF